MRQLIFSLLLIFSFSCKRGETPYEVTYEVSVRTDSPVYLMISYRTDTGRVVVHTNEKQWSEKVSQPAGGLASLLVFASYAPDSLPVWDLPGLSAEGYLPHRKMVSGRIVHSEKVVRETAEDLVLISLSSSEIRKGFW